MRPSLATVGGGEAERRRGPARTPARQVPRGRVLLVEERELVAVGIRVALSRLGWQVETSDGPAAEDVVEAARRLRPHCALVDVHHGDGIGSGIALVAPLAATGARVVMLTAERRRTVLAECLEAGAAGWISKDAGLDEVDAALRRLLDDGDLTGPTVRASLFDALRDERCRAARARATFDQLTEREGLVLAALTDGLSADEIAREHYVALTTVRSQIRAVLQKLGVRSQLAAVALAVPHRELLPRRGADGHDRRRGIPGGQGYGPEFSADIA